MASINKIVNLLELEDIFKYFYKEISKNEKTIEQSLYFYNEYEDTIKYDYTSGYLKWDDVEEINNLVNEYIDKRKELRKSRKFNHISKKISESLKHIRAMYDNSESIYNLANFNEQEFKNEYLERNSLSAYDENLAYYADEASYSAQDEKEKLLNDAENDMNLFFNSTTEFKEQLFNVLDIIDKAK